LCVLVSFKNLLSQIGRFRFLAVIAALVNVVLLLILLSFSYHFFFFSLE